LNNTSYAADLDAIRAAHDRISPHIHRTPIHTCEALDTLAGRHLFFKCENFQKVGAFKMRGALNAVLLLPAASAAKGVVTHSSGNFAQALSLAARMRGIPAYIVMPSNAPEVKQAAVMGYGGQITLCEPTLEAREATAERIRNDTGAALLHPFDHPDVIAGQGTVALEIFEQSPDLDAMVVPVGGGGLVSGIALAYRELAPEVPVMAAEPAGADDAARSKASGTWIKQNAPDTIADGLLTSLGQWTWPVIRDVVAEVLVTEDDAIIAAMRLIWERMKLVIEPSAAVPLAACLDPNFQARGGLGRVGILLSGGNVDLSRLPFRL